MVVSRTPEKPPTARAQRLLVVDDEVDILESVQGLLDGALPAATVDVAASGPEGLKLLERVHYDLILTDFKMPGMNGLEFLAKARQLAPKARRMMLTAFPDLDLAVAALNDAKIERFLVKPIDPDELIEAIQQVLKDEATATRDLMGQARSLGELRKRDA